MGMIFSKRRHGVLERNIQENESEKEVDSNKTLERGINDAEVVG
jgi:hypothetical protein